MSEYVSCTNKDCTWCDTVACNAPNWSFAQKLICPLRAKPATKYSPGQFDERARNHGQSVIDEMRKATGIKDGTAHSVCVTVYIDGYLQFAGADACLGPEVSRKDAKTQAMFILQRMDPEGKMTTGNSK